MPIAATKQNRECDVIPIIASKATSIQTQAIAEISVYCGFITHLSIYMSLVTLPATETLLYLTLLYLALNASLTLLHVRNRWNKLFLHTRQFTFKA